MTKSIKSQILVDTLKSKDNQIFILEQSIEQLKQSLQKQNQTIEAFEKNKKIQDE